MRKHFKKIVILSLFFFLISSFGSNASVQSPLRESYEFGLVIMEWPGDPDTYDIGPMTNNIIRQCVKKNYSTQITFCDVTLNLSFLQAFWDDGSACFGAGTYVGTLAIAEDSTGLHAIFLFNAKDKKGIKDVQYRLHLFNGTFIDSYDGISSTKRTLPCEPEGPASIHWPPYDMNDITIIKFDEWETFVLNQESKKCVGSLNLPSVYFIVTNYGEVLQPE